MKKKISLIQIILIGIFLILGVNFLYDSITLRNNINIIKEGVDILKQENIELKQENIILQDSIRKQDSIYYLKFREICDKYVK